MRILALTPVADPGGGKMRLVATFDLQITEDIRLCGMRLLRAPDGQLLTYAPMAVGGRRSVTFSPEMTTEIRQAAVRYYEEHVTADGAYSEA